MLVGAVLVYITKSKGKRVAFIPWVVSFFAVPATLGFLFSCPDVNIAGIHTVVGNRYHSFCCMQHCLRGTYMLLHSHDIVYVVP